MKKLVLFLVGILVLSSCSENKSKNKSSNNKSTETTTASTGKSEEDFITDSIRMDSLNPDLYVNRARINLTNERVSSAIQDINKALSLEKENIDALLVLADIYYALGDENNILLTLNKACEYAPLDTRPIIKLAELSFLQGNSQLANAYVDKALEMDRFNPRAYFMRGVIALANNDTVNALKYYMTARVQQEDFIDPIIQIAHIYAAQGDTLAKSFFKEAINLSPGDYSLYYDYAMYLQDNGYPEEALSYYDTLLTVIPNNPNFIYNKGYVYFVYLNDNDKALEYFNKALEYEPGSVNALFNKGRVYEEMGNYIEARRIYLQILKNNPDYQLAIDAVNRVGE